MASETQQIEFKVNWRDEHLKWICGFANSEGGMLCIGIDDKGNVIGLSNAKKLMEDIPNKIASTMGIIAQVSLMNKDGPMYLKVSIPTSSAPVAYHGKYYLRSGTTLQELTGIALQDFVMKKMGLTWEAQAVPNATLKDIDPEAVKYFIEAGIEAKRIPESARNDSIERILKNRKLIDASERLTLAALLLFGINPQKFCITSGVKIGMFGAGYSDLEGQDIVGGNLIQIVEKVIELLDKKYLIRPIYYEGLRRREPLEIPIEALREILYNAVVHKDYRGPEITIRVFKDRIRIANEGNLPKEITIESLFKSHESKRRNELIAGAFYAAGFIEAWGRGYEKIRKAFESENLQLPVVYEEGGFFCVEIKREKYTAINGFGTLNTALNEISNSQKLSERQIDILKEFLYCANFGTFNGTLNGTLNSEELSTKLNIPRRSLSRELRILVSKGFIRRIGSKKNGHWELVGKSNQ